MNIILKQYPSPQLAKFHSNHQITEEIWGN
jgi:hypothetical protein